MCTWSCFANARPTNNVCTWDTHKHTRYNWGPQHCEWEKTAASWIVDPNSVLLLSACAWLIDFESWIIFLVTCDRCRCWRWTTDDRRQSNRTMMGSNREKSEWEKIIRVMENQFNLVNSFSLFKKNVIETQFCTVHFSMPFFPFTSIDTASICYWINCIRWWFEAISIAFAISRTTK